MATVRAITYDAGRNGNSSDADLRKTTVTGSSDALTSSNSAQKLVWSNQTDVLSKGQIVEVRSDGGTVYLSFTGDAVSGAGHQINDGESIPFQVDGDRQHVSVID